MMASIVQNCGSKATPAVPYSMLTIFFFTDFFWTGATEEQIKELLIVEEEKETGVPFTLSFNAWLQAFFATGTKTDDIRKQNPCTTFCSDLATFSAVKILSTCCRDRGASIEMPPVTIDIVGGHKPMEPEIKMVSLTCRKESGWYRISHYTP